MNHVRKQQWMGCGVASAAMLADLSYEDVMARWPHLDAAEVRWPKELCGLLAKATDTDWQLCQCRHPLEPVRAFPFPRCPVAAFTEDDAVRPRFGHWIVVHDQLVHDPGEPGACHLRKYRRRDWLVTWIARPSEPGALARSRTRNRLHAVRNVLPLLPRA